MKADTNIIVCQDIIRIKEFMIIICYIIFWTEREPIIAPLERTP